MAPFYGRIYGRNTTGHTDQEAGFRARIELAGKGGDTGPKE